MQKTFALSSTEAEYGTLCDLAKEVMFLQQVQHFWGPTVHEYLVRLFEDNSGAIMLAEKTASGGRTKHIDIRYHYVRNQVKEGKVKIMYVNSGEQHGDLFTKPLSDNVFVSFSLDIHDEWTEQGSVSRVYLSMCRIKI
ncbi:unnamed protein product [Choristocarpus tenellus]